MFSAVTQNSDYILYNMEGNIIQTFSYKDIVSKCNRIRNSTIIVNAHNGSKLNEIYLLMSTHGSQW